MFSNHRDLLAQLGGQSIGSLFRHLGIDGCATLGGELDGCGLVILGCNNNLEPLISTICPPAEKYGPFQSIECSPVKVVDDEGGCAVCPEDEAQFWSIYARCFDGRAICLADCEAKEIAIELESLVRRLLPAVPFTAGDLLRATALSVFAMQKAYRVT